MTSYIIKGNARNTGMRISGKVVLGAKGDKGDKGDPGTTDYNELDNKPDLALKADKTYVDAEDAALQDAIDTKADTSSLAPVATSGDYADLTNKPAPQDISGKADKTYVDSQDTSVASTAQSNLTAHTSNTSNPHSVTKAQVGLGNVDNTSDANKPVSTATQSALNEKANFPTSSANVPVRDASGNQGQLPYDAGISNSSIVRRTGTGTIQGSTATVNTELTTKLQMDTADALKVNKAGDTMTGRLGNATANLSTSNTRGGKEILFGATAIGNFGALNNTDGIEFFNALSDGTGITLGASNSTAILKGTGFPNGVVSAPVGSTYIDTAATNGAIEWKKATGSSTTGWVVSVGDTGWRNLADEFIGLSLRVRRVNGTVYHRWSGTANVTGNSTAYSYPSGFRGDLFTPWIYFQGGSMTNPRVADDGGAAIFYGLTNSSVNYPTSAVSVSEQWPTTLPGTAA